MFEQIILQITEPPGDFMKFLLWFIGILVSVIAFFFSLLKASMTDRLTDRDATIATLRIDIAKVEFQRDKLMEEVKSTLDNSNQVFQSLITILKK